MRLAAFIVAVACFFSAVQIHAEENPTVIAVSSLPELLKAVKETRSKIILLNVWGPDCSPCLAEMPSLVRLANTVFKGHSDLAIIGLSLGDEGAKKEAALELAKTIIKKKGLPYPNFVWVGAGDVLREKLGIEGTPTNLLLSPEGKVLGEIEVSANPDKAEAELSKLLNDALVKLKASATKSEQAK